MWEQVQRPGSERKNPPCRTENRSLGSKGASRESPGWRAGGSPWLSVLDFQLRARVSLKGKPCDQLDRSGVENLGSRWHNPGSVPCGPGNHSCPSQEDPMKLQVVTHWPCI